MPSTYTLNNGIELIANGEQSGTWGDTTNTNLGLIDTALDGQVTITLASAGTSGSPNTLPISDGSASNGRNRLVIFNDGGDLGATAYVQLTPNDAEKIVYIRNNLSGSRSIIVFQGTYNASNDYEIPAGTTAVIFFNGGGAGAVAANVFNNAFFDSLRLGAVSVTAILDEDNMASDSATALATQQSIKAYVDAQVTAQDLDFAGDTGTGAVDLDSQTFTIAGTVNEIETSASGQTITVGLPNAVTIASLTATTADINGGTIDGTVIGAASAAAGTFTTVTASGDVTIADKIVHDGDTNTSIRFPAADTVTVETSGTERMRINSSGNVGIGTSSPSELLDVNGDALINGITVGRSAGNLTNNTALGSLALESNTTGNVNTAVGREALESNTTGDGNTASGYQALESNTTGTGNAALGSQALKSNTTGTGNAASGLQALTSNTTGGGNTAVGRQALESNTTGNVNTALGSLALESNTTGNNNAAVGRQALESNTTGDDNTASGFQALTSNTTGNQNTAVGRAAGNVITTGARNTILGFGCDPSALDGNDQVVVGYNLTGKGNDTAFIGGTGGAYNEKNVTTWETTSDERIKKNITDNNDGLAVLSKIQVRNFEYRTPDEIADLPSHAAVEQEGVQLGVIAQELQQVLPECVNENSTGVLSVNTDPLIWYLINAVKELKAEIAEMKGE